MDIVPDRTKRRRVTRLASVAVAVPDPEATASFLSRALGFLVNQDVGGAWRVTCPGEYGIPAPASMLDLYTSDDGSQSATLVGLRFDVKDLSSLEELRELLKERGVKSFDSDGTKGSFGDSGREVLLASVGSGIGFHDPNGVAIWCSLPGPSFEGKMSDSAVWPRRLGHVNLTVAQPSASALFFTEVLGLRLSEQIGDAFYFLRVASEHHNLGLRAGVESSAVHHIGFEVNGWESYRIICDHLAWLGHQVEYGPGRHGPGRNLFVYVRDPASGLRIELYSDMAHIYDEVGYVPHRWELSERERTVNRWGPSPPESFLA